MKHIGFIMDGNRRWAKKLQNIASFGHRHGFDSVDRVLEMCFVASIPCVSMWGLSKENISERSPEEIEAIYDIMRTKIPTLIPKMQEKSIKFETVGDLWLLPADIRTLLIDASQSTETGSAMTFVLAFAYSGQDEIVRAVKRCMQEGIDLSGLTEETFLKYLDTGAYPPPDIIVRTGGNIRHSGYFLYQSAYSEYFFTETLWPDFSQKDFDAVISYYETEIQRNFGK